MSGANLRKFILFDANGRELELTNQSNIPVEVVDSNGLNLDLTPQSNVPVEVVDSNNLNLDLTAQSNVPVAIKDATGKELALTNDIRVPVEVEYSRAETVDLYLYRTDATPVISVDTNIDDTTINVVSSVGVVVGETITIYEGPFIFQSIVTAITATTISFASGLDFAFTTAAEVETGPFNMAVDGSVTNQIFAIKAPIGQIVHLHTISASMLDSSAMDDALFGGRPALTNGIIYRLIDGFIKQLTIITNNAGFFQYGFDVEYSTKAPAGQYGYKVRRLIPAINGAMIELNGNNDGEFQLIVRDDLTGLNEFVSVAHGHVV